VRGLPRNRRAPSVVSSSVYDTVAMHDHKPEFDPEKLKRIIGDASRALGFSAFGVAGIDLEDAGARLNDWLVREYHGQMSYMANHGDKRFRPGELVPGTVRCLSFAMDYLPQPMHVMEQLLERRQTAYVARYALGRDYHRYIRRKLQKLAGIIEDQVGHFGYRVFTDSAPVMEKPLAAGAGLGWIGKHTNLIDRARGSWFFLGEIYTDLPLPIDAPVADHCGTCTRCIDVCPTAAIVAPYVLDARRCISYLTIEHRGDIPVPLRALMGNRIFGCDDCQLFCPWNRFAQTTTHDAFSPRKDFESPELVELLLWSEAQYLERTEGSALRRIGHERWLRNVAVALGNAATGPEVIEALQKRLAHPDSMVRRHVAWALARHGIEAAVESDQVEGTAGEET
jgi:epoxyqueuosine reductase